VSFAKKVSSHFGGFHPQITYCSHNRAEAPPASKVQAARLL